MVLCKMKTIIRNQDDKTWFIVAFEEEFQSTEHNVLYLEAAGKITAAMATQWLIDNYDPEEIINVGTAGGNPNNKNIEIGRIYAIGTVIDRDYKVFDKTKPGIVIDEVNSFNKCYTGDSFVENWDNTDMGIVDMEAYAIAKVCIHPENNIPFTCFKYISDTGSDVDWHENLKDCNRKFNEIFKRSNL